MYLLEDGLQKKWQSKIDGELSAVYLSDSKKLWVGTADGRLIQLDPTTGILFSKLLWQVLGLSVFLNYQAIEYW